ncbi:MAG: precorrin-8X methylmutase [Thermodesulfobacteriota bacterium]
MQPDEIEKKSFEIIGKEAGTHGFDPAAWTVVARMIHTSADFDYIQTVRIHPGAISAGISAIREGATIFTDTRMAMAGIRRRDLNAYGGEVKCLMEEPAIAETAAQKGITRAEAAVEAAAAMLSGGIYVVGNAPTALLKLISLIRSASARPALVVGLPVGFVNAAESKAELLKTDIPYITNEGRKGGSNVAAAVVNALIQMAGTRHAGDEK